MGEHVDAARTVSLPSAAAFGGGAAHARPSGPVAPTGSNPSPASAVLPTSTNGSSAAATDVPSRSAGPAVVDRVDAAGRPTPSSVRVARVAVASEDVGDDRPGDEGGTGDHAVDEALTLLDTLEELPLREHVAVFDGVHAALQDRLADTEG